MSNTGGWLGRKEVRNTAMSIRLVQNLYVMLGYRNFDAVLQLRSCCTRTLISMYHDTTVLWIAMLTTLMLLLSSNNDGGCQCPLPTCANMQQIWAETSCVECCVHSFVFCAKCDVHCIVHLCFNFDSAQIAHICTPLCPAHWTLALPTVRGGGTWQGGIWGMATIRQHKYCQDSDFDFD